MARDFGPRRRGSSLSLRTTGAVSPEGRGARGAWIRTWSRSLWEMAATTVSEQYAEVSVQQSLGSAVASLARLRGLLGELVAKANRLNEEYLAEQRDVGGGGGGAAPAHAG